jgi:hypothetical protein
MSICSGVIFQSRSLDRTVTCECSTDMTGNTAPRLKQSGWLVVGIRPRDCWFMICSLLPLSYGMIIADSIPASWHKRIVCLCVNKQTSKAPHCSLLLSIQI